MLAVPSDGQDARATATPMNVSVFAPMPMKTESVDSRLEVQWQSSPSFDAGAEMSVPSQPSHGKKMLEMRDDPDELLKTKREKFPPTLLAD
jgi:hypothetical protein